MKVPKSIKGVVKKISFVREFIDTYNPSVGHLLDSIFDNRDNKIVLDVGANEGQTIDWALGYFNRPSIYAFEPTPDLYNFLKSKYSDREDVTVNDIALSDSTGKAKFYVSRFSPTNSLLKANRSTYDEFNQGLSEVLSMSDEVEVKIDTLDNWARESLRGRTVDLLKSDTQGNEFRVMKGGENFIRDNVKAVIMEVQYLDFYEGSIPFYKTYELLYENGFYLYNYVGGHKVNRMHLIENDVIFLNKKYFDVNAKET